MIMLDDELKATPSELHELACEDNVTLNRNKQRNTFKFGP
jgi:hypothetical protein